MVFSYCVKYDSTFFHEAKSYVSSYLFLSFCVQYTDKTYSAFIKHLVSYLICDIAGNASLDSWDMLNKKWTNSKFIIIKIILNITNLTLEDTELW